MSKTRPVHLKTPVTIDGAVYSELTFRPMKARDALVAEGENSEIMAGYKMFAALADVPVEVILELDMGDLVKVSAEVTPMMGKLPGAPAAHNQTDKASPGET